MASGKGEESWACTYCGWSCTDNPKKLKCPNCLRREWAHYTPDQYEKLRPCLDHPEFWELAVYAGGESITVECTKHGTVLHELYNAEEDVKK